MGVGTSPATDRRDPGSVLWLLTGVGWLTMLALMLVPDGMWGMPAMAAAGLTGQVPALPPAWMLAVFIGAWVVMVTAMMLPTTVPMARMFTVVTSDVPARRAVATAFFGAYLVVWLAAGVLGLGVAALVTWATVGVPDGLVLAGALALAGLFQFSALKWRCLTRCREPRAFLFARYRRGVGGAWSLGLRHVLSCLGCCWALMAVMFAIGSGGLVWMLGLTAVMVGEKTAPWGRRLVKPVGFALLAAALVVAVIAFSGPDVGVYDPMPARHHHT